MVSYYRVVEHRYLDPSTPDLVPQDELQSAIISLYQEILLYQMKAADHFSHKTPVRMLRNTLALDNWESTARSITLAHEACEQFIHHFINDSVVKAIRQECQKSRDVHQLTQRERDDQRELKELHAYYQRVFGADSLYLNFKERVPPRVQGTCDWVLNHHCYQQWLREDHSCILWISADPGCGKSVLSKFLIDESLATEAENVLYFFFKEGDPRQETAERALCAILHQLYATQKQLLLDAKTTFDNSSEVCLPNDLHRLWQLFLNAVSDDSTGSTICIIDALDECEADSINELIKRILKFFQQNIESTRTTHSIKFLVTSRPYHDLEMAFSPLVGKRPMIRLAGEKQSESIRHEIDLVIEDKVRILGSTMSLTPDVQDHIQRKLKSITHRTYLWLHLVLDILKAAPRGTERRFDKVIDHLPDSVNKAYRRILDRSSDIKRAKRLLQIVVAAYRPLSLKEIDVALNLTEGSKSYDDLDLQPESSLEKELRDLCGLFITVIDSKIYLIHQTAREFLLRSQTDTEVPDHNACPSPWNFCLQDCHLLVARTCMWMFFLEESSDSECFGRSTHYHFSYYAEFHWTRHIREASNVSTLRDLVSKICDTYPANPGWNYSRSRYSELCRPHRETITKLMLVSSLALPNLVECFLDDCEDVDVADSNGRPAIFWALRAAYDGTHDCGLDEGGFIAEEDHSISLSVEEVVRLFLDRKASLAVSQEKHKGGHLLHRAFDLGYLNVVTLLLNAEADVQARNEDGDPIAHRLRHHMNDLSQNGGPIQDVIDTFLRVGGNLNEMNLSGQTALQLACEERKTDAALELIGRGANVNLKSEGESAALVCAIVNDSDNEELVKALLVGGANPNPADGLLPLVAAVLTRKEHLISLLIKSGADPNASYGLSRSSMSHVATTSQGLSQRLVRKLLRHLAEFSGLLDDFFTRWNFGVTPLFVALMVSDESAVNLLLEHGATLSGGLRRIDEDLLGLGIAVAERLKPEMAQRYRKEDIEESPSDLLKANRRIAEKISIAIQRDQTRISEPFPVGDLLGPQGRLTTQMQALRLESTQKGNGRKHSRHLSMELYVPPGKRQHMIVS